MPLADQLAVTGVREIPSNSPQGLNIYQGLPVSGWLINVTPGAISDNNKFEINVVTDQNPTLLFRHYETIGLKDVKSVTVKNPSTASNPINIVTVAYVLYYSV